MSGAAASGEAPAPRAVDVVVGVLRDGRGRWLVTSRPAGKELEGWWEFPGGKRAAAEERHAALTRELDEELGIAVESAEPLLALEHRYPDKLVRLDVWLVTRYRGKPTPQEGQELRWLPASALAAARILPADLPIVARLQALERDAAPGRGGASPVSRSRAGSERPG